MVDILNGAAAATLIIVSGALYAALLALGRRHGSRASLRAANAAYATLVAGVIWLAWALHLSGYWIAVLAPMLVGYWCAPRAIWLLCVGTHAEAQDPPAESNRGAAQ
jgi:hypothetical protein